MATSTLGLLAFFLNTWVTAEVRSDLLASHPVTNWGDWGTLQNCPSGTFVTGFQLKTERWNYGNMFWDDTCLNAIRFFCGRPGEASITSISSTEGDWGTWGSVFDCNGSGYATGFMLRSEEEGTASLDETAANNLRILCHGSTTGFIEGGGETWGEWTSPRHCQNHQYICGLQTQVQGYQGLTGDDTVLNNIKVECCNLNSADMVRFNITNN